MKKAMSEAKKYKDSLSVHKHVIIDSLNAVLFRQMTPAQRDLIQKALNAAQRIKI